MEYRKLGRTELSVSSIGLGCVTFGREIDEDASFVVMDRALERGITLFDTAEAYAKGSSETVVGRWLADRGVRDQIVLATKVSGVLTRDRVISSAEASLQRLQTDVIDLFQVHHFDAKTPLNETLEALDALVKAGKVRYIGCSNYAAWQLCKSLWQQDVHDWARFESVQPNYNLVV
ncbi:MAG: aldo/keto reductase, partial [Caldilineaceae bacterium]|nr:aldo/keto reductase [Caldilineaceae bacterium]